MLALLERTRVTLEQQFPRTVTAVTVVMHERVASLVAAIPPFALVWVASTPAARRYLAGWVTLSEIHLLAPSVLAARASNVNGSAEMLALAPATLYARRVLVECNHDLHAARAPARVALALRWAWLLEGGAHYFSGESKHARGAIARRLHEGRRPSFPPGPRDAALLGGTVIDLIARENGERAAAQFACRLHPDGPRAALVKVFDGRPLVHTEGTWRSHLASLASGG